MAGNNRQARREGGGSQAGGFINEATNHFQRQFFKTELCKFWEQGWCKKGKLCKYAHGKQELQERPDLTNTTMCSQMIAYGNCKDSNCPFAHHLSDLRSTKGFYKKLLCNFHRFGKCTLGDNCRYAHSVSELRQVDSGLRGDSKGAHRAKGPWQAQEGLGVEGAESDESDEELNDNGTGPFLRSMTAPANMSPQSTFQTPPQERMCSRQAREHPQQVCQGQTGEEESDEDFNAVRTMHFTRSVTSPAGMNPQQNQHHMFQNYLEPWARAHTCGELDLVEEIDEFEDDDIGDAPQFSFARSVTSPAEETASAKQDGHVANPPHASMQMNRPYTAHSRRRLMKTPMGDFDRQSGERHRGNLTNHVPSAVFHNPLQQHWPMDGGTNSWANQADHPGQMHRQSSCFSQTPSMDSLDDYALDDMWERMQTMPADISKGHCGGKGRRVSGGDFMPPQRMSRRSFGSSTHGTLPSMCSSAISSPGDLSQQGSCRGVIAPHRLSQPPSLDNLDDYDSDICFTRGQTMPADIPKRRGGGKGPHAPGGEGWLSSTQDPRFMLPQRMCRIGSSQTHGTLPSMCQVGRQSSVSQTPSLDTLDDYVSEHGWARMQTMPADMSRHCGGEVQRVLGGEGHHFCPPSIMSNRPTGQTVAMLQGVPAVGATQGAGELPGASIPLGPTANPSISNPPPGQTLVVMQVVPVLMPSFSMLDQACARQVLEDAMPEVYED